MRGLTKLSLAAAIIGIGSLLISYIGGPSQAAIDNTPDCDTVAIMYCGAFSESQFHSKWNNDTKYSDHATVFSAFGISKAEVTGMVEGVVWRDGRVTLSDGTLVATNAITAGRWNNPASDMTRIAGTSRAYKMSTRHFVTEGQTAMIKMVDGQFKFAVIKSCGNPVTATPQPKPAAVCSSLKAVADPNNIFRYNFTITASATNGAKIHDYVINYGDGTAAQTSTSNTFSHTYTKAGTYTIKSSVRVIIPGEKYAKTITSQACETQITIKEQPKNITVCRLSDKKYPVTIKETEFDPAKHSKDPNDCKEVVQPIAKCIALDQPVITNRTDVTLKATASAENGAKITGYVFTILNSEGQQIASKTVNTDATSATTTMAVTAAGSYTTKVVVKTSLGDRVATTCEKSFTITEEAKPGIKITKTVNGVKKDVVSINEPFTYEILVENTGNVDLKDAKIEDKAPEGVTFKSAGTGKIVNNVWTHTIADFKKGSQSKFTITATVSKYFEGNLKNTACVDTPTIPGQPDACDDAEITTKKPGVNITKKVNGAKHDKVNLNAPFKYELTVINNGETNLTNVKVTDKQPEHIQFLSADRGNIADGEWSYTIPSLKIDESMSFTIEAKAIKQVDHKIKNTACVDAPQIPGSPDDCDDATVELEPEEIPVCELDTKTYPVMIDKADFDESKHSRNAADCDVPKVPETPVVELPKTGPTDGILNALGIGALTTSALAYIASRRHSLLG